MIDICIISDGKTQALRDLTQSCIYGAKRNKSDTICISDAELHHYEGVDRRKVYNRESFNYNHELNELAKKGKNPYIAFCNNDLVFDKMWSHILINAMKQLGADSASPFCPVAHGSYYGDPVWTYLKGYHTRKILAGWCFVWTREFWEQNPLPTEYNFWCADNATENVLRKKKALHILVRDSKVKHLGGKTTELLDNETKESYTKGNVKKWNRNTGENKFGWGK